MELASEIAHELDGGTVGDGLGDIVPARGLLGAEIRAGEDLLETNDLRAGVGSLADIDEMLVDHGLADGGERCFRAAIVRPARLRGRGTPGGYDRQRLGERAGGIVGADVCEFDIEAESPGPAIEQVAVAEQVECREL